MGYVNVSGVGPWLDKKNKATPAEMAAGVDNEKYATPYGVMSDQIRQDVAHEKLKNKVAMMEDMQTNHITTNPFYVDFEDISELDMMRGNYDPLRQRLDCSYVVEVVV